VPPAPGCTSERGCPAGLACVEGGCVGNVAPAGVWLLRVRPRLDTPHGTVDLLDEIAFPGGAVRRLGVVHIPLLSTITGRVTLDGRDVEANVTAVAIDGISEQPLQFRADPVDGAFVLHMAPAWPKQGTGGRAVPFRLRVSPPSETLPPFEPPSSRLEPRIEVVLPAGPLRRLDGVVRVSADNPTPLRDVAVRAVDTSGRSVSTTSTTDETGAFSLGLWPEGDDEVVLRVNATLPEFPLPALELPVHVSDGEVTVLVGDVGSTFTVTGVVRAVGEVAPAEARVVFRADVGNGRFTTSTITDAEGRFEATLYAGDYLIDVIPPEPYRLARLQRTLTAESAPLELAASPRVRVDGCLRDWGGDPVEGATVSARLTEPGFGDPRLEALGPGTVPDRVTTSKESNENGQFTLHTDGGVHRLTIVAPVVRGLPSINVEVERVSPDTGSVDLGRNGCIVIPPAAVIAADLVGEDGEPVAGAVVEAWRRREEGVAKAAQATSGSDGHVVLVIPNR